MTIGTINYKKLTTKAFNTVVDGTYRTPRTINIIGNMTVSTSVFKFGAGSGYTNSGNGNINITSSADFDYTSSTDFTYEGWFRFDSNAQLCFLIDQRTASGTLAPCVYYTNGTIYYYTGGSARITRTWSPNANTWYHIALVRYQGVTKLYVDGNDGGLSYTDSNNYVQGGNITIGADYNNTSRLAGYFDEIRVSAIARYTANFTSPTSEFKNDLPTLVLIHCNDTFYDYVR